MLNIRSPFNKTLSGTMHWGRLIDKVRLHLTSELPEEFEMALGHPHGVDGHFLEHFSITLDQIKEVVAQQSDAELAAWLIAQVDGFPEKRDIWNELGPQLGKAGFPMERALKIALRRLYRGTSLSPEQGVFNLIEIDEGRA